MPRLMARASLVLAVVIAMLPLVAAPAKAMTVTLECSGQSNVFYDPPLTNAPQDVLVTTEGRFGSEGSPGTCAYVGPPPAVTSMTYDDAALIPDASCTTVNNLTLPGSRVYTWNDGQTSTFSYTTTIVGIGAQVFVLRTGKIIAGRFTGATAEQIGTVPTLNPLDCLAAGVTNTSADGIVTILG